MAVEREKRVAVDELKKRELDLVSKQGTEADEPRRIGKLSALMGQLGDETVDEAGRSDGTSRGSLAATPWARGSSFEDFRRLGIADVTSELGSRDVLPAFAAVADRRAASLFHHARSTGAIAEDDPATSELFAQTSGGEALPAELRTELEGELGISLGRVRIHTDAVAAGAAKAMGADAFSVGEDVFFADGRFGRQLLMRELARIARKQGAHAPLERQEPAKAKQSRDGDIGRLRKALKSMAGSGAALPAQLARDFSRLLGADLSHVRVHTSGPASAAAQEMKAAAFTHGAHVAFAPGAYDPSSAKSRHILAHELVHVVQNQRAGGAAMRLAARLDEGPSGSPIEREAEAGARAILRGQSFVVSAHSSLPGISKWGDDELDGGAPPGGVPDGGVAQPDGGTQPQTADAGAQPQPHPTATPTPTPQTADAGAQPQPQPQAQPQAHPTPTPDAPSAGVPDAGTPQPVAHGHGGTGGEGLPGGVPGPVPQPHPTPTPGTAQLDARVREVLEQRADPAARTQYDRGISEINILRLQALQYSFSPSGFGNTLFQMFVFPTEAVSEHWGQIYSNNAYRGNQSAGFNADTLQMAIEGLRGSLHLIGDIAAYISGWAGVVALISAGLALITSETIIGGLGFGAIAAAADMVATVTALVKLMLDIIDALLGVAQMVILIIRARASSDPAARARFAQLLRKESGDLAANVVSCALQVAVIVATAGTGAAFARTAERSFLRTWGSEINKLLNPRVVFAGGMRGIVGRLAVEEVGRGVSAGGRRVLAVEAEEGLVAINRLRRGPRGRVTAQREVIPFTHHNQMRGARLIQVNPRVAYIAAKSATVTVAAAGAEQLKVVTRAPSAGGTRPGEAGPLHVANAAEGPGPLTHVSMWPSQIEAFQTAKAPLAAAKERAEEQHHHASEQAGHERAHQIDERLREALHRSRAQQTAGAGVQGDAVAGQRQSEQGATAAATGRGHETRAHGTQSQIAGQGSRIGGQADQMHAPPPRDGILGSIYNATIGRIGAAIGSAQNWLKNLVGKIVMWAAGFTPEELNMAGIESDMRFSGQQDRQSQTEGAESAEQASEVQQAVYQLQRDQTTDQQQAIQAMADTMYFIEALEEAEHTLAEAIANGNQYMEAVSPIIRHELETQVGGNAIDAAYVAPITGYADTFTESLADDGTGARAQAQAHAQFEAMKAAFPTLNTSSGEAQVATRVAEYNSAYATIAGRARDEAQRIKGVLQGFVGTTDYDGVNVNAQALDTLVAAFDRQASDLVDQLYAAINSVLTGYITQIDEACAAVTAGPADAGDAGTTPGTTAPDASTSTAPDASTSAAPDASTSSSTGPEPAITPMPQPEPAFTPAPQPEPAFTPMQPKADGPIAHAAARPAASGGEALPAAVRGSMERSFGADFSGVRVHQDERASSVGAQAFAQGDNLHFAPGQYDPGSQRGQELIGHELAHVVQQRQGRVAAPGAKGVGIVQDASLEAEADVMGSRAARGQLAGTASGGSAGTTAAIQMRGPTASVVAASHSFTIPPVEDLGRIVDPVLRNHAINQGYHTIDTAMTGYLGDPLVSNWFTFGQHASREAGTQIQNLQAGLQVLNEALLAFRTFTFAGTLATVIVESRRAIATIERIMGLLQAEGMIAQAMRLAMMRAGISERELQMLVVEAGVALASLPLGPLAALVVVPVAAHISWAVARLVVAIPAIIRSVELIYQNMVTGNRQIYENVAPAAHNFLAAAQNAPNGVPGPLAVVNDPNGFVSAAFAEYAECRRLGDEARAVPGTPEATQKIALRRQKAAHANLLVGMQEQLIILQPLFDTMMEELRAMSGTMVLHDPNGAHPLAGNWGDFYTRMGIDRTRAPADPRDIRPGTLPPLLPAAQRTGTIGSYFEDNVGDERIHEAPPDIAPFGGPIRRKAVGGAAAPTAGMNTTAGTSMMGKAASPAAAKHSIAPRTSRGSGAPLPARLQQKFEQSLGADLSGVRIHTDAEAAANAASVNALAFARGQDISFAAGQYNPDSPEGEELLAHEVAHTVQQRGAAPTTQSKLAMTEVGDRAETEADTAARSMVSGEPAQVSAQSESIARWGIGGRMGPGGGGVAADPTPEWKVKAGPAKDYVQKYERDLFYFVDGVMKGAGFVTSLPSVTWKDGNSGEFAKSITWGTLYQEGDLWTNLQRALTPDDVEQLIDHGRDAISLPDRAKFWNNGVGYEIAKALTRKVQASLDRIVPRYLSVWNQNALAEEAKQKATNQKDKKEAPAPPPEPQAADVRSSHPIDPYVIRSLSKRLAADFSAFRKPDPAEQQAHPIKRLLSKVTLDIQWKQGAINWARAAEAEATAEDVANELYGSETHAYLITAAPPLFGFETSFEAKGLLKQKYRDELWKIQGNNDYHGSTGRSDVLNAAEKQILAGPMGDEAALNQAKNIKATPGISKAAIVERMRHIVDEFVWIQKHATPFGQETRVEAAKKRVDDRSREIDKSQDPSAGEIWDGQTQEQLRVLGQVRNAIMMAAKQLDYFKGFEATRQLVMRLVVDYLEAAAVSDLTQTAAQKLKAADDRSLMFPADLMDTVLDAFRQVIHTAAINKRKSDGSVGNGYEDRYETTRLDKQEHQLRFALVKVRELLKTDPKKAQAEVERLLAEITTMSSEVTLVANLDSCDALFAACENSMGKIGWVTGKLNDDWGNALLENDQKDINEMHKEWKGIYDRWKAAKTPQDKAPIEKELSDKAKTEKWTKLHKRIADHITDVETMNKWVTFGVMVGIAIVTGGIGAYVEAGVGAAWGAGAAFAASTIVEAAVFSGLTTTLITKDATLAKFYDDFENNIIMFGALKGLGKIYGAGAGAVGINAGEGIGKAGGILVQYAALNGHALYVADQQQRKVTGKGLSDDQILSISFENLAFIAAITVGGELAKPFMNKVVATGKLHGELLVAQNSGNHAFELAKSVEAAKGKNAAQAKELVKAVEKALKAREQALKTLDEKVKEYEAGNKDALTEEAYNQIKAEQSSLAEKKIILERAKVARFLEPSGPDRFDSTKEGVQKVVDHYKSEPALNGVKPEVELVGEDPITKAKTWEIRLKDTPPWRITERMSAKEGELHRTPEIDHSPIKPELPTNNTGKPTPAEAAAAHAEAVRARAENHKRSGQLKAFATSAIVDGHVMFKFQRLIGGTGFAAAMDANTLPGAARGADPAPLTGLPQTMGVGTGSDVFSKLGEMTVGQKAPEYDSRGWAPGAQPRNFTADHSNYTNAMTLADATAVTQYRSGVGILDVQIVEVSVAKDATWKVDAKVRMKVLLDGKETYLYSDHTDVATGLGPARQIELRNVNADPIKAAEYKMTLEDSKRIVYGDDPFSQKSGDVLVSGGSATAAWNVELARKLGADVAWVAGDFTPTVPPRLEAAKLEFDANEKKLNDPNTAPDQVEKLMNRQAELRAFEAAHLPRNLEPAGAALKDPAVKRMVKSIVKMTPSEALGKKPGQVVVEFSDGSTGTFDQVVISHGTNLAAPTSSGSGGALTLLPTTIELRPVVVDGKVVALESIDPPGAVRVMGAAMWSPAWINRIPPALQEVYTVALANQALGGPRDSPGNMLVHNVGKQVPAANTGVWSKSN